MNLERSLRVLPVILCAVLAAADAVGQGATDNATKSMKVAPTAARARGVRMGVTINPVTDALAAQLGLEASKGILVEDVVEGGPSAKAGLARYDVIVAMNDEPVSSEKGLRDHLAGLHAGDTVSVKILRKGETMLIPVVVDERPADESPLSLYGGNSMVTPNAPDQSADESQLREWAEAQRAATEQFAKQQAQWAEQLAERSKAFAEEFRQQHQAEIDKWTAELVEHVDTWRKQAEELNTPENRAKFEEQIREYVNQLVDQTHGDLSWNILRRPSIRYYTTKDGKHQAVVGDQSEVTEMPVEAADLSSRLDSIEQRMQKIEQMLEKIADAGAAHSAGK